jgi:hypothetical protein
MPRSRGSRVEVEPVVALAESSAQTGQRTAKIAAQILRDNGFIIPTAAQREALLIAFVRAGYVIYGRGAESFRANGRTRTGTVLPTGI